MSESSDKARELLSKATPGPWALWNGWGPLVGSDPPIMACERIGSEVNTAIMPGEGAVDVYGSQADLELIAAAPSLLASLFDEVELLEAVVEAAKTYVAVEPVDRDYFNYRDELVASLDRLSEPEGT